MQTNRRDFIRTAAALAAASSLPALAIAEEVDPFDALFDKLVQKEADRQGLKLYPEVDLSTSSHLHTAFYIHKDVLTRVDRDQYLTETYIRPCLMSLIRSVNGCTQLRVTREKGLVVETGDSYPWMSELPEDSLVIVISLYAPTKQTYI